MSLTDQENFKRTWGRFPKLWSMLENQPISEAYASLASDDETYFSHLEQTYSIVIRYLSATDDYIPMSQDPMKNLSDCERQQRAKLLGEIDQLSEDLAEAAYRLERISEEIRGRKDLAHYLCFSRNAGSDF